MNWKIRRFHLRYELFLYSFTFVIMRVVDDMDEDPPPRDTPPPPPPPSGYLNAITLSSFEKNALLLL